MVIDTVRTWIALILFGLAFAWPSAAAEVVTTPRVEAHLISEVTGVPASGGLISVALYQRMQPEWHTYWRNPGESGEPTTLTWALPGGFNASEIKWPHPERIPYGELANYGYSHQVLLRTEIAVPPGLPPGTKVTLKVDAAWLVCKDICVPEAGTLDITLPVVEGTPERNAQWQSLFDKTRDAEPKLDRPLVGRFSVGENGVTLYFEPNGDTFTLYFGEREADGLSLDTLQFFPYAKGLIKASTPQSVQTREDGFRIVVARGWRLRDQNQLGAIDKIDGIWVVKSPSGDKSMAFEVSLQKGGVPATATEPAASSIPLFQAILFAILGGLILNLMPCVFPILSMKALSLVHSSHADRPWIDGLVYTIGVMSTFAALAGILLWLRSLGEDVGWGFQLQSPLSVAVLAYILAGVGFSLSGLFHLGSSLQDAGQGLSNQTGLVGTFFTGVLAVVVAAPCTAPFMGAAMSFAFTQSAPVTIAVFLALGFGLALPWLLFSVSPPLIRLLPRPGPWMDSFKQFLAFPMYAAAAWLVWVLSQQVSPEGLFRVMMGLVTLGLAAWALGNVQARAAQSKVSITGMLLFLLGLGAAIALVAIPFEPARVAQASEDAPSSHAYAQTYSAARLASLLAEGKPVFVNLTAAWCVSCLYNERVALSSDAVRAAFRDTGTVYLVGDWTNRNPEISALLKQHGRDGVPLYLYFAAGSSEPRILPQLLTQDLILATLKDGK